MVQKPLDLQRRNFGQRQVADVWKQVGRELAIPLDGFRGAVPGCVVLEPVIQESAERVGIRLHKRPGISFDQQSPQFSLGISLAWKPAAEKPDALAFHRAPNLHLKTPRDFT
jgi:hypothetical protein